MTQNNAAVRIYSPDLTLKEKIGIDSLDEIFTLESIKEAQKKIEKASNDFLTSCTPLMSELSVAFEDYKHKPAQTNRALPKMIDTAFSIKTNAKQGGNVLASCIAESLQNHSEQALLQGNTHKSLELLEWHVNNLCFFLRKKIKGYGDKAGEDLMRQIAALPANKKK